ncbi:hypothetical protein AK830_g3797 [Neonectria ditissima]|uniref:Glutathione S-transferase n=1 Tax=Neonectria ditissima TaxID=78410 RepID=A0A0P7BPL9_9HYPO|nr:hypothetical protein AK830_g3797 [Neonectria ditissima]
MPSGTHLSQDLSRDLSHPALGVEGDPFARWLVYLPRSPESTVSLPSSRKWDSRRSCPDAFLINTSLSTVPGDRSVSRHVCHCGKAFIRKEHLRRHQATHGERNFVCSICQRSFTRNDLLRRHLTRHDLTSTPDSRRGRACDACHANKTKCDGGTQCSLCSKRGISCTFKLASSNGRASGSPTGAKNDEQSTTDPALLSGISTTDEDARQDSPAAVPVGGLGLDSQHNPSDHPAVVGLARLTKILASRVTTLKEDFQITSKDREWFEASSDEYLGRFHEGWPVIHAPTFYTESLPIGLTTTVVMIGAWLKDPEATNDIVLETHRVLMDRFFEELSKPTPRDLAEQPWQTDLYQSIVLHIIFAFYYGDEKIIARAVLLKGMLVAVLREIEFFVCSSSGHQQRIHFPGTFLPWVQSIRERWKRTIASLYKIDTYLSIARWQPPTIHREELDVALPSTFALWNAHGLDVFFKRLPQEPADRTSYKLSEITNNPNSRARSLLLLEDVHLALCGLHPGIWNHLQITRRTGAVGLDSLRSLAWHLETWKAELERISQQCSQSFLTEKTAGLPFVAYLGRFDEDPSRERHAATVHIKCLLSDALMLYHIQGMQLYADVRTISAVATYMDTPTQNEPSTPPRIQNYQAQLHEWAATAESRRALLHAVGALRMREAVADANEPQTRYIDPIAYLATSMSALVVWAWIMYAEATCSCIPSLDHINIGVDPPDLQSTARLENWIHSGGTAGQEDLKKESVMYHVWSVSTKTCVTAAITKNPLQPTMPRLTLYQANGSCAIVPHAVLLHFDIPATAVEMIFGPEGVESADGTISHADYLKIHPQGYVPALDVDGEVITELPAILNYISSLVPEANLFTDTGLGRARVAEWLNWLSGTMHSVGFGMLLRPGRFSDDPAAFDQVKAKGKAVIHKCFARIDTRMEGKEFAVGDSLTAADFYIYLFSRWGKQIDIDMAAEYPNYSSFARRLESVEGIKKAVEVERLKFMYL